MEEQSQNKTIPIEIKEEFDEDITIQPESIKEEVLDEGEKNCEISKDQQPTIIEQQQKLPTIVDNQQQLEIKSELFIDHQINNNEPENSRVNAEEILSWSTNLDNSGYPGFIEAIRQARNKKQSHDVSFEILFSYLPESVIKQHDLNLNEWWNYCLFENKDPLETDLSVVNSYLEKKLDAGASPDDLESISSTVRLIASDKMEKQMSSSRFLFINKTDCFKTPKSSCQNNSKTLSLNIEIKKKDESQIASVQIEKAKKTKLPEVIDISDNDLYTESPTTLLEKSKDLLNNNEPTNLKNNSVFLTKAIDSSHLITPLMKPTSTKPPAILLCPASKKKVSKNNAIKKLIPGSINGQQTQSSMSNVVVGDKSDLTNEKYPTVIMPILKRQQDEVIQQHQSTLSTANDNQENNLLKNNVALSPLTPCQLNKYALECSSTALDQGKVETGGNLQSGSLLVNAVVNEQQQKPLANNNQAIDPPTKTMTPALKPSTSAKLLVHPNIQPSTPCEIKTSLSECSSKGKKQKRVEKTADLQTELQLSNAAPKNQQQLEKAELINIDKSDRKLISDLSDTSIHSDNSLDEIELTNNTESYAYLQKAIDNPQTEIVQDQVEGNVVKMLVVMPKNEQRLIIFDLPNEKCTVHDLLEQASIPFNGTTTVSLVKDPIFKINYIVETEAGTVVDSTETDDVNDELSNDDNVLSDEKCLQDDNDDNNIHATSTVNIEEPKYIDGKLAVCDKCGLPSMDFNRCYYCRKKIQDNPKTMPYACQPAQKKDMMLSIDKYYKSEKVNNDIKNDNTKLNLHTTSIDPNNLSSNINKRQPSIGNTNSNDIIENMTIYPARKSINKLDCPKLSSNNQATNTNNQQNKKLNDGIGEFINNNSTQVSTIISIEKPKYIDGKLAVCDNCGSSSIDFNRCYYCKKKIKINTKTKLDKSQPSQKKNMIYKIDKFYKKLSNNDTGDVKNELSNDGSVFPDKKYLQANTFRNIIGSVRKRFKPLSKPKFTAKSNS
ncbi:hypothetical protein HCN44_007111 [Aphidius gifuensis]|uniref:Uncharacterized protein n=1 Tax=Aphidius gifuensis TaxID=684658 RepID=A0A834XQ04_APHGI|nr:hypothetical protein HCN44_007111 [Aphidius gifuensis]